MEFQVSARKWRPQKFAELIGQEHIVRTLVNAIELDRVSHAYLFSGTRGVGKTTTARIFAKVLNCQNRKASEPCDACTHCLEIKQGSNLDVQEIDGASNNGVAEARDLIENIQYAASSCDYRVYIIDEVHMLSKNAFNALLKTLEEPPAKVIFIFATTEQNKIPETILSRCQCFEFKPLLPKQIVQQLDQICKHDGIDIDRRSLEEVAKNGSGSMRDAQSLLDQVIAFCGKKVEHGSVEAVLGIVGQSALESFVDRLIKRDAAGLLDQVQEIANSGKDLNTFCRDLVEYIRNLLMAQVAKNPETILDSQTCDLELLARQSKLLDTDVWHQMFMVLMRTETEMKRSSMARAVFEMTVLRLADIRPFREVDALVEAIKQAETEMFGEETPSPTPLGEQPPPANPETIATPVPAVRQDEGASPSAWEQIKKEISAKKSCFNHYLTVCELVELNDSVIHLQVSDPYTKELIGKAENISAIRKGVQTVCQLDVKVELTLSSQNNGENDSLSPNNTAKKKLKDYNKKNEIAKSEFIQEALDIFGGVVTR